MNINQYLSQNGYSVKQVTVNGQFNLGIFKGDTKVLHIKAPPNVPVNQQELVDIIKNQIELYEMEDSNEQKRNEGSVHNDSDIRCEEVRSTTEEPSEVS